MVIISNSVPFVFLFYSGTAHSRRATSCSSSPPSPPPSGSDTYSPPPSPSSLISHTTTTQNLAPESLRPAILYLNTSIMDLNTIKNKEHLYMKTSSQRQAQEMNCLRKKMRMIKNRESASISRIKKKEHLKHLEEQIRILDLENRGLRTENENLKAVLKDIKSFNFDKELR